MISYDLYENLNINRTILILAGLWPYNQSKFTRIQIIMCLGILLSFTVFQLTPLLTSECTPDFVIIVFSSSFSSFINFIMYNSFVINNHKVRYLLEQLRQICNEITDENEIAIIKSYGINAKRYTTLFILVGITFFVFVQLMWLRVFDIFLPENKPRRQLQLMVVEYFFDQEKYFYLIFLHTNAAIILSLLLAIGSGTLFLMYFRHVCGMFKIASYRLEQIMQVNVQHNINLETVIMIYKNIVCAVDIHRKAMMMSTSIMKVFEGSLFFLATSLVIDMSLNLYRIFRIILFEGDRMQILIPLGYVSAIFLYLFLANYSAQQVIDHNDNIYVAVYNIRWYMTPLHIQKLILLLLQRGNKPFYLPVGKLFVASLEYFATLISASMSYFTIICSTQQ